MKKTVLAIVFLVNAIFSLSAQQFKELTLAEKLAEPELSFALTFDKKDLNADFALGEKASLTLPDESLLLRGLVGFDSAGAYKPEPGESLKFAAPGNADPHQGTLSLWVCALDYNPCDELTEGEKRGNIALAQLWFQQGEKHINMQLYEYANTVYFDWRNSEPPHSFGQVARIQTLREGIRQGEWHQIVCTWQDKQIFLYLNGKLIDQAYLPEKCSKTADLQTEAEKSFIGVKSRFYEDNHKWAVGIDDYKIYSRALSALEVENRYKRLLDGEQALDIRAWDISLNGVNIGYDDPIERLEAEFDFAGLSAEKKETLLSGNLKMQYRLSDPQGNTVSQGDWSFTQARESKILSGLNQVGTYSLHTRIGDEEQSAEIYRPDFSWTGNQLGNEDSVPQIWRDFAVEGRQVRLWNRSYVFGAGPLPESIQAYGQELLLQTPQLLIADRDISWQAGPTIEKNSTVTYTGTGKAKDFSIEYATRVEFDGLIKMNFSINGEPELSDMRLQWRCRPELSTYLMTPRLQMQGGPQFAFQYPGDDEDHRQLWLVSEGKGGFAYSMQNDANWIYEKGEKLFFANQESGLCEVRMICKKVKMPPGTAYEALFIATPTRPLPRENRMLNFDGQRGTYGFLHAGGDGGLSGVFTMEPHPEGFTRKVAAARPNSYSVYGAANALTTLEPEAVYLRKYWDMPGSYSYKMPYHRPLPEGGSEKVYGFSLSACNSGVINDYYLKGIAKLFAHPYGDRIWQIYYDLCGNSLCRSAVHGCRFNDQFGREIIGTYSILNKRKLIERTVRYCHAQGRTVMLHAQRSYYPMLQGMADYYFPGEQHSSILRRNPYAYTDEIADELYRSEYNRNVLGIGVIFLPALGQANLENFREPAWPYTTAMLMMLQMHDVDTAMSWAARVPTHKLWNALEKYQFEHESVQAHLYYEQKQVLSSNPQVRVTWYDTPKNHKVLILGNKDVFAHETEIDLSALNPGSFQAREEFEGEDVQVSNGKFSISVPSRSMRIVAYPPKTLFPFEDSFRRPWGFWKGEDSDARYEHELKQGRGDQFSLRLVNGEKTGVFTKTLPVHPGRRYSASVWCLSELDNSASIGFQGKKDGKFLGLPVQKSSSDIAAGKWQQVQLSFLIPEQGKWAQCNELLITLGAESQKEILFDDFVMMEDKEAK